MLSGHACASYAPQNGPAKVYNFAEASSFASKTLVLVNLESPPLESATYCLQILPTGKEGNQKAICHIELWESTIGLNADCLYAC